MLSSLVCKFLEASKVLSKVALKTTLYSLPSSSTLGANVTISSLSSSTVCLTTPLSKNLASIFLKL